MIRYGVSIALLIVAFASVFLMRPECCAIAVLMLLYVSNVLDDCVFYYGSEKINVPIYRCFLSCPVNGTVTNIEDGVPLMAHITKCDCLTKEVILELKRHQSKKLYNHITIFLNKFNKHIVTNIGCPVKSIRQFDPNTKKYCMVENGLVPKKNGKYLTNPFVRVDYENGVVCVFTLDKYVSELVINEHKAPYGVDMFICRGSQCDVYIPKDYTFCPKYGQTVKNYDTLSFMPCKEVNLNEKYVCDDTKKLVEASGIRKSQIILTNITKTLGIFKNTSPIYLVCLYVGCVFGHPLEIIDIFLLMFAFHRFYKNYLYMKINKKGLLRPSRLYNSVEKIRNLMIWL